MTPQVTKSESYKVNKMICNVLQVVMFLTTQLTKLHIEIKFKNECVCFLGNKGLNVKSNKGKKGSKLTFRHRASSTSI